MVGVRILINKLFCKINHCRVKSSDNIWVAQIFGDFDFPPDVRLDSVVLDKVDGDEFSSAFSVLEALGVVDGTEAA